MKEAQVMDVRASVLPHRRHKAVLPNCWQGEADCIVGPFSGRTVAEYFANAVVDFGQYETVSRHIFAKGDAWFVEVLECRAAPVLPAPSLS